MKETRHETMPSIRFDGFRYVVALHRAACRPAAVRLAPRQRRLVWAVGRAKRRQDGWTVGDIDGGSIQIDGQDIRQLRRPTLRRQLGIVLQDTFLFSESVLENIRYGRLSATDEECIAAAKLADADPFIRRLPQGYNTPLSERGSNLSQGQRQLLSIARAILADPGILILDEATSSVDTRTEARIQESLLRLMAGRTNFVIAHRLSTIRDADQILVIDDGEIVEQGTHQQLLDRRGFFHHLYVSQFKGQEI